MDLKEFCEFSGLTLKRIAHDLDIGYDNLYRTYAKKGKTTLETAYILNNYSNGLIKYEDLVSENVKGKFDSKIKYDDEFTNDKDFLNWLLLNPDVS